MAFRYNPPTRTFCKVCEAAVEQDPIIDSNRGRASSADNFAIHNWFNFTLGYTPEFPEFLLEREGLKKDAVIGDPFVGSGTTNVVAKAMGYVTLGTEANDFFHFAANTKMHWDIEPKVAHETIEDFIATIQRSLEARGWVSYNLDEMRKSFDDFIFKNRPEELVERYISNAPFAKLTVIKGEWELFNWPNDAIRDLARLALMATVLPVSNVKYGPGFGVTKAKEDAPVLDVFSKRVRRMVADLSEPTVRSHKSIQSEVYLGDARQLSQYFGTDSIDYLITSPPYPGDHEYTKHSRLELMFMDLAMTKEEFRVIKKRMLRGSTTNIYKDDNEGDLVKSLKSIEDVVDEIDSRLKEDGATSGFEKLYTKLIWEYFGGMFKVFKEAKLALKPGGKFALLVSDSHAFKMVHIATADLLSEVALLAGFENFEIELWQYKKSTSHKFKMHESILTVY